MAGVFYFPLIGTPTGMGYALSFFEAGTSTPLDVWTDSDLTIPWAQPIILNAAGESDGPIYVSPSPAYKVKYERPIIEDDLDSDYVAVPGYPVDFVSPSTIINVTTSSITDLTNAQIKALPSTPITLIAAPAAGLRIKPLSATIRVNAAAGAYTNINATYAALFINYSGDATQFVLDGVVDDATFTGANRVTGLLGTALDQFVDIGPYVDTPSNGLTAVLWTLPNVQKISSAGAKALVITMDNNGSGNLLGGNAANSMTVTVYYALESVA